MDVWHEEWNKISNKLTILLTGTEIDWMGSASSLQVTSLNNAINNNIIYLAIWEGILSINCQGTCI